MLLRIMAASTKNVRQIIHAGIKIPSMLSRVALHFGFQKVQQTQHNPGIVLKVVGILLQALLHVVHPLRCTLGVHDRIGVGLMVKVES
jgi:hypothetical protein